MEGPWRAADVAVAERRMLRICAGRVQGRETRRSNIAAEHASTIARTAQKDADVNAAERALGDPGVARRAAAALFAIGCTLRPGAEVVDCRGIADAQAAAFVLPHVPALQPPVPLGMRSMAEIGRMLLRSPHVHAALRADDLAPLACELSATRRRR